MSKKISHFGLPYRNYEVIIYKIVYSFTYCRSNIDTLDLTFEVMIIDNFTLYFFFFWESTLHNFRDGKWKRKSNHCCYLSPMVSHLWGKFLICHYCFLNIDKINNSGSTGSAQCICLTSQSNSRFFHICTIVTVSALVVKNNIFTCETSFIPKYFSTWQIGETHTLKKSGKKGNKESFHSIRVLKLNWLCWLLRTTYHQLKTIIKKI